MFGSKELAIWTMLVGCASIVPIHASAAEPPTASGPIRIEPTTVKLTHPRRPQSLIVTSTTADGRAVDLTAQATFTSNNSSIARVTSLGWVEPVATGEADVTVTAAGQTSTVHVSVQLPAVTPLNSFRHDVMPALSKGGCNAGACHGYSLGKNGFKLSLRGADAAADYLSLSDEFFERRINRHNPPASLLLAKPLGDMPHKGGVRFDRGSLLEELLAGWISDGAPDDTVAPVQIESLRIYPTSVVIGPGQQHQLQLIARYSDGSERDVTRLGIYTANTERVAGVDDEGLVSTRELGETAVVARFERIFATSNFIVLEPRPGFEPTPVPSDNLIDRHVVAKLNDLRIKPSETTDDVHFLRRVYVDLIGVQPKADELAAFLADGAVDKRSKIVETLFQRPEFVDRWSLKWGDLLQNSRTNLNDPATYAFREWIRVAVATNMPLDEFARTILNSRGGTFDDPTSAYFAVSKDTDDTLQRATQVFCGVRMLCAKCHPHPFENWTQTDYYGLHSFFNQLGVKADQRLVGVPNAKTLIVNVAVGSSVNPRTGAAQPPRYLGGSEPTIAANTDRRAVYAQWLTSAENPFFARSMTNRIWSYFFHRGIIDPVDDLRTTNPPINPALLDALTKDFVEHRFDVRHLMRSIVLSQTYQRSSATNETNAHDDANFSHFISRRLPAETLLDSLTQATGVPENFAGVPAGFTAAQLPDADVQSDFLNLFGKPQRMEACECERDDGSNMLQALHFINGPTILGKLTNPGGRLATLVKQQTDNRALIEQIYLWSVVRPPDAKEVEVALTFFNSKPDHRDQAAQDLMWALLNSRDFLMVH
ncbi:MAG TPA: DUF1553 domain-containing protein [Pirellulales bacterium]|nr:DUF1553 domain-containing protein [Pirellulales bacterium]